MTWTHDLLRPIEYSSRHAAVCKYAHTKIDGHRVTVYKQRDGQIIILTPLGTQVDLRSYGWYGSLAKMPPMSSIDMELYVEGRQASFVKTALSNPEIPLKFSVFAIPWYNGTAIYNMDLNDVAELAASHGLPFARSYELFPVWTADTLIKQALALHIEGWVLKRANYREWYKLKPVKTLDAFVTGFVAGNGKYMDTVGALRCSVYYDGHIVEVAQVSGMDDETRYAITDKDLGRVCEVAYQYVGAGKRLRHPRFKRWRDDKTAEQCTVNQDSDLCTM